MWWLVVGGFSFCQGQNHRECFVALTSFPPRAIPPPTLDVVLCCMCEWCARWFVKRPLPFPSSQPRGFVCFTVLNRWELF